MERLKKAIALGALLLLTGCSMSGMPIVGGFFQQDYFPMKKDAVWFYLEKKAGVDSGRSTFEISSVATNGDTTMASFDDGAWFAKKVKDKLSLGVGTAREEFKLPPETGASWSFTLNDATVTGKVAAKESSLTLPYGNVSDVYRIEYTDKDNKPIKGSLGFTKVWLAPGIGIVKLERPDANDANKLDTLELESYQLSEN